MSKTCARKNYVLPASDLSAFRSPTPPTFQASDLPCSILLCRRQDPATSPPPIRPCDLPGLRTLRISTSPPPIQPLNLPSLRPLRLPTSPPSKRPSKLPAIRYPSCRYGRDHRKRGGLFNPPNHRQSNSTDDESTATSMKEG